MLRPTSSSGDVIADRRYAYAIDLARAGDCAAAIDVMAQAIERAREWVAAWRELGRLKRGAGDRDGAAAAFRECLRLDPADPFGVILELATLGAADGVDAAPHAYVEALFDAYAPDFDTALVERLDYKAPRALAAMLRTLTPETGARRFPRALDLGCGTGLAGEALRADIAWLEGVDLSAGMLARAGAKGVYDALQQGDLLATLGSVGDPYDLIIASDVFSYIGDLAPVIAAVSRRLTAGGLVAFTIEKGGEPDWRVEASLRFAHAPAYVRRIAAECGLDIAAIEDAVLRKDRGADIAGMIIALRKPYAAPGADQIFEGPSAHDDPPPAFARRRD